MALHEKRLTSAPLSSEFELRKGVRGPQSVVAAAGEGDSPKVLSELSVKVGGKAKVADLQEGRFLAVQQAVVQLQIPACSTGLDVAHEVCQS